MADGIPPDFSKAELLRRIEVRWQKLEGLLDALVPADWERPLLPYSHYQPGDPPYDANPVVGWLVGNTFGHFDEHIGWREAGLTG